MAVEVSIIIPVYNSVAWLTSCLDSVLGQDLRDIEVIAVDDGSSDGSYDMLLQRAHTDCRLVVLPPERRGAGASRNRGLGIARGRYVAFLDADDLYADAGVLGRMVRAADTSGCKIAGGYMVAFKGDVPADYSTCRHAGGTYRGMQGKTLYRDFQNPYGYTCYVYETDFLRQHGLVFPATTRFEDPIFFVEAMMASGGFYAMDECVYLYRQSHKTVDFRANNFALLKEQIRGGLALLEIANRYRLQELAEYIMRETMGFVSTMEKLRAVRDEVLVMLQNFKHGGLLSRADWRWLARWLLNEEPKPCRLWTALRMIGMRYLLFG